jgi:hypothetical protein
MENNSSVIKLFLVWMVLTMLLTFSLVGLIMFLPNGSYRSSWMTIGIKLVNKITGSNDTDTN